MYRMKCITRLAIVFAFSLMLFQKTYSQQAPSFEVPVDYYKLPNGLKVVLSTDHTAPTVAVGVYYNIGFRIEPKNRTGFAHLFEHLMFQGSKNLGKMEFINLVVQNGGVLNGSTRFDFTNYFEVVPSNTLEMMLWGEADRMKGLNITQENLVNQQGVVKNEVKVNVLNQPYGGFPWLDMPQYANKNWFNAHNFYGDLKDIDAATLEDAVDFFNTFYRPNNAVLVVSGDFNIAEAKQWINKYFSAIPSAPLPPPQDIREPRQEKEQRFSKNDSLATKPAISFAYHMPERKSKEYFAMGLIDQMLVQGKDSKLHQYIVQRKGYASNVNGGINYLGNMFNYNGPMLWMCDMIYDANVPTDSITHYFDKAIADVSNITEADLQLAKTKMQSSLYDMLGGFFGVNRLDLLAVFALFDDDPHQINSLANNFYALSINDVKETAKKYLRPENRTILNLHPTPKQ